MSQHLSWMRSLGAVIMGLCAASWEIAVRPFLPDWFSLPALMPLLVLLLVGSTRFRGYLVTIVGALCLQIYVVGVQDFLMIRWLLVFFLLDLLGTRLLTNRSFYVTVALASVGYLLERLTSFLFGTMAWHLGLSPYPWSFQQAPLWGFVWTIVLAGMGFIVLAFFTKRFSTNVTRSAHTRFS